MGQIPTKIDQQHSDLEIREDQWLTMGKIIRDAKDFDQLRFHSLEFRFVPMVDQTKSALLSYGGIDVFHFMWTEVDGLVEITHRLVNPQFRNQGIGSRVMEMIADRVQALSNARQSRYSLSLETSQFDVAKLALKSGMLMTQNAEVFGELTQDQGRYRLDEHSHVRDLNNYQVVFRLSRAFQPEIALLQDYRSRFRDHIRDVLALRAA